MTTATTGCSTFVGCVALPPAPETNTKGLPLIDLGGSPSLVTSTSGSACLRMSLTTSSPRPTHLRGHPGECVHPQPTPQSGCCGAPVPAREHRGRPGGRSSPRSPVRSRWNAGYGHDGKQGSPVLSTRHVHRRPRRHLL